jgi:hypothetical protein
MTVFSSVEAAARFGFRWLEYRADLNLHLVVADFVGGDGRRYRALAFARP